MVTNVYPLQLNRDFSIRFQVNFGTKDDSGADGIAFLMSNVCSPVLNTGQGLGVSGIQNSIIIELDTWNNGEGVNDIPQDHCAIYADGQLSTAGNITDGTNQPVCLLPGCGNVEDGQWYNVEIRWEYISASLQRISLFFNGQLRVSSTRNHITERFNNSNVIFWSVSAATGGNSNLQQFRVDPNNNNVINTCEGQTITLTAPELGTGYSWSGGASSTSHTATFTALNSGTITCTYTDFCGQPGSVSFSLTVNPNPVALVNSQVACSLRPAVVAAVPDNTLNYSYVWTVPTGLTDPGNTASFNTTVPGTYSVVITDKATGCSSRPASGTLSFIPVITPVFTTQGPYCQGVNIPDLPTVSNNRVPGSWSPAINNQQTTLYRFTPEPSVCAVGDSMTIVINPKPTASLIPDTAVCKGTVLTLNPTVTGNQLQFLWQDGSTNRIYRAVQPGTYTVLVRNDCGTATASVNITEAMCKVFVPNAFTPNGDGLNDQFRISGGVNIEDFTLQIYNRWGMMIFESRNPRQGWDGTLNGVPQPPGLYVYRIRFVNPETKEEETRNGKLQLLR